MDDPDQIYWPKSFSPSNCHVDVRNELEIASSPKVVWAWLIRAMLWPTWYPNSAKMRFIEGQPPDLSLGTRFKWKTGFFNPDTWKAGSFGVTVDCKVQEFIPPERLAYEFNGIGIGGYQAWLITKNEIGCRVLTEERQRGFVSRFVSRTSKRMKKQHQLWLEALRDGAVTGFPP
jgi:hypothetical protein